MDLAHHSFDRRYSRYEFSINKVDSTDNQNDFDPGFEPIRGFHVHNLEELKIVNPKAHRKHKKDSRRKIMA